MSKTYRGSKEYLLIYSELIKAAQHHGVVTYQELADLVGLPLQGNFMGKELGHYTGEISREEMEHGRPMLSAIVVGASGKPGEDSSGWRKSPAGSRVTIPQNKTPFGRQRRRQSMRRGRRRSTNDDAILPTLS
jgi:hypothetical protein